MKTLITTKPINPKSLSKTELNQLTETLYPIQQEVFDGVSKESFRKYVLESPSVFSRIYLFKNQEEKVVGYISFHVYETRLMKKRLLSNREVAKKNYVFRTETGLLREYRGGTPIDLIFLKEAITFWLKKGFPTCWFMATPVHPTPYCVANRSTFELYPRPNQKTPEKIQGLMDQLSQQLHLEEANQENPLVKKVGWIVRSTQSMQERLKKSNSPDVRFYLEQNPGYVQGNGMMILAPGTVKNAIGSGLKMLRRRLRRRAGFRSFERILVSFFGGVMGKLAFWERHLIGRKEPALSTTEGMPRQAQQRIRMNAWQLPKLRS